MNRRKVQMVAERRMYCDNSATSFEKLESTLLQPAGLAARSCCRSRSSSRPSPLEDETANI